MALDRLKAMAQQVSGATPLPHPFDPLTNTEIELAVQTVRKAHGQLFYNAVTLWEPRKKQMLAWLANPAQAPRPARVADVVAIGKGGVVFEGLVDLKETKILKWETLEGVQPLVSYNNLIIYLSSILIPTDHYGRSPDRRARRPKRPKSHRTVHSQWSSQGGYAQSLL